MLTKEERPPKVNTLMVEDLQQEKERKKRIDEFENRVGGA